MNMEFGLNNPMAGIHLVIFQWFKVPYEMCIDAEKIRFMLKDDLPPKLYFDIGYSVGKLDLELDRLFQEQIWPLNR